MLVFTEGVVTEKQYIEGLNQELRGAGVSVSVKTVGVGRDPRAVVTKCVERRRADARSGKEYDRCFCVVDVDDHATLDDAVKLAAAEGIELIVSRLKFEVWLLWHVVESGVRGTSRHLDELAATHEVTKGKNLVVRFPFSNYPQAVRCARKADPRFASGRVGPDPSSAMPVLVEAMGGYLG